MTPSLQMHRFQQAAAGHEQMKFGNHEFMNSLAHEFMQRVVNA